MRKHLMQGRANSTEKEELRADADELQGLLQVAFSATICRILLLYPVSDTNIP